MFKSALRVQGSDCVCKPGAVEWIQLWFADCVYTSGDLLGFLVGLTSVFFWMIAQMPQFMTNILRQSAEALSPWFLFQWLAGDTLNLLGCVLTGDQLSTETFTAYYFILSDCLILSQFFYYQSRNKDRGYFSDESLHKPQHGYHTAITVHPEIANADIAKSVREVGDCSSKSTENVTKACADKPAAKKSSGRFGIMARGERFQDFEEDKLNQTARKSGETSNLRRQLRRVILEYGLEYGPPSASRLSTRQAVHVSRVQLKHRGERSKALCLTGMLAAVGLFGKQHLGASSFHQENKYVRTGRKLLMLCTSSGSRLVWMKKTGTIFGIVSAGLYLGSRISQLAKNHQRKSAEGLSLAMVSCAVLANLTYGSAILIRLKSWEDFMSKAPWLVGSLGTVSLDIAIFIQAQYLSSKYSESSEPNERTPLLRV